LTAKEKLDEAGFHLDKMRESYLNQEEFTYYLSAFLAACRSVPDHLLEEYNAKYQLGISLSEQLNADRFESKADQIRHLDALNFIQIWRYKVKAMKDDPVGGLLLSKRNLNVHRLLVRPNLVKVSVQDTGHFSERVTVQKFDKNGKLVEIYESPPEQSPKKEERPACVDWYFKEYDQEPILTVCERFLRKLRDLVDEIQGRSK
jgi:hypothetical protein